MKDNSFSCTRKMSLSLSFTGSIASKHLALVLPALCHPCSQETSISHRVNQRKNCWLVVAAVHHGHHLPPFPTSAEASPSCLHPEPQRICFLFRYIGPTEHHRDLERTVTVYEEVGFMPQLLGLFPARSHHESGCLLSNTSRAWALPVVS